MACFPAAPGSALGKRLLRCALLQHPPLLPFHDSALDAALRGSREGTKVRAAGQTDHCLVSRGTKVGIAKEINQFALKGKTFSERLSGSPVCERPN